MEFQSVIKDECGTVVRICSKYTNKENEEFLQNHPEYYYSTIEVEQEERVSRE